MASITSSDLTKGIIIKFEGQPWLVIDFQFSGPGKGASFYRTKLKNLATGTVLEKTFKSGEKLEEATTEKIKAKFLYSHRDRFFFCKENNPSSRFDLPKQIIGNSAVFLKQNEIVEAILFEGKIITVSLPIKVNLKVTEAPPSFKGDTAQGGTKMVTLETGAQINVPLFVEEGDIIEVNTETGEYVRRVK